MNEMVTVELIYKCETQAEYQALLDHFGIFTPKGYNRVDDAVNLCMRLEKTERVEIDSA